VEEGCIGRTSRLATDVLGGRVRISAAFGHNRNAV